MFWHPGVAARIQGKFGGWCSPERGDSHASSSHEVSLEPTSKRREDLGKHSVEIYFCKDRNCEICKRTKITRAPCRRRNGGAVPRAENFGDLITADDKVLSENWISKQSSICSRGAGLCHSMEPVVSVQNNNFTGNPEKLAKVLGARQETWSHLHLQFFGIWQSLWRSLLESLHVSATQIRNKWDCWKSSAQSKGRHLWCIVAIRSEWKLVGRFHGMLHLSARRHRSIVWWRDVLGNHLKDRLFKLVHWLSITSELRRTSQESINLERKSYLDCSSDTHCTRGEFGRVTYRSQTLRSRKRWTHRKSTQKRLNAKEVIFPKEKGNFIFPVADGRINHLGGDQDLRTSTSIRQRPIQGESHLDFLENQKGLFHHLTTRFRMPVKQLMISGPCQETSCSAITLNLKSSFIRRKKNHFLFHWHTLMYPELLIRIWMSSKRNASMITGISMGQEICLILGQVSLYLIYWKKNLQTEKCGPGWE